jgi:hypothetical protein
MDAVGLPAKKRVPKGLKKFTKSQQHFSLFSTFTFFYFFAVMTAQKEKKVNVETIIQEIPYRIKWSKLVLLPVARVFTIVWAM